MQVVARAVRCALRAELRRLERLLPLLPLLRARLPGVSKGLRDASEDSEQMLLLPKENDTSSITPRVSILSEPRPSAAAAAAPGRRLHAH